MKKKYGPIPAEFLDNMNRHNALYWCGVLLLSMENGNVADETVSRENLNRLGFDVVRARKKRAKRQATDEGCEREGT